MLHAELKQFALWRVARWRKHQMTLGCVGLGDLLGHAQGQCGIAGLEEIEIGPVEQPHVILRALAQVTVCLAHLGRVQRLTSGRVEQVATERFESRQALASQQVVKLQLVAERAIGEAATQAGNLNPPCELQDFRARYSTAGNPIFGAVDEGSHDDVVLAVALAAFGATRSEPVMQLNIRNNWVIQRRPNRENRPIEVLERSQVFRLHQRRCRRPGHVRGDAQRSR